MPPSQPLLTSSELISLCQKAEEPVDSFPDMAGKVMNVIAFASFALAFGFLFVMPLLLQGRRSLRLLLIYYRGETSPFASAWAMFLGILRRCLPGIHNWERMTLLFDATRIVVEFALLNPLEDAANTDTAAEGAADSGRKWHLNRKLWRKMAWKRLDDFLRACDQRQDISKDLPPLEVANCFALSKREDEARRYFEALQDDLHVTEHRSRFLSSVEFSSGYVAPLFLIHGSLNRFDEDWHLLHNHYGNEISSAEWHDVLKAKLRPSTSKEDDFSKELKRLRALQLHEFDCWLQWGPSIPICSCNQWHHTGQKDGSIALQFGFGDENNSIPLLPGLNDSNDGKEKEEYKSLLESVMACLPSTDSNVAPGKTNHEEGALAIQQKITARPVWAVPGKRDSEYEDVSKMLCPAQKAIFTEHGPETVLDYIRHSTISSDEAANYYSAYLWVMFVLCYEDKIENNKTVIRPLFPIDPSKNQAASCYEEARKMLSNASVTEDVLEKLDKIMKLDPKEWQGLIPFFEHANIANADACNKLKEILAQKAVRTLNGICESFGKDTQLRFVCVCSVDDTGCSNSPRTTHRPQSQSSQGGQPQPSFKPTIIDLIRKEVEKAPAGTSSKSPYIFIPEADSVSPNHIELTIQNWESYSSCRLPALIERYLNCLEEFASNPQERKDPV